MLQVIGGINVEFAVEEVEVKEVSENMFVVEFSYEQDMFNACYKIQTFDKAGFVQTDVRPQKGRFFRFEKDGVVLDIRYSGMGGFISGGIYESVPVRGLGNIPKLEKAKRAVEIAKKAQVVDVFEEGGSVAVIAKRDDEKYFAKWYVGVFTEKNLVVISYSSIYFTAEEVEEQRQLRQKAELQKIEYERKLAEDKAAEEAWKIRQEELRKPKSLLKRIFG